MVYVALLGSKALPQSSLVKSSVPSIYIVVLVLANEVYVKVINSKAPLSRDPITEMGVEDMVEHILFFAIVKMIIKCLNFSISAKKILILAKPSPAQPSPGKPSSAHLSPSKSIQAQPI
jgi:hypothetical protein